MGGRRSYRLKDVVGTGRKVGHLKAQLTTSFKTKDIEGVSKSSANLVIEHKDIGKIIIYGNKLLSSIKDNYSGKDLNNLKDVYRIIRIDWTNLKHKEKLSSNSIIDSAVIDNVSRVLKEINK